MFNFSRYASKDTTKTSRDLSSNYTPMCSQNFRTFLILLEEERATLLPKDSKPEL